jgi:HEAT repeat protein
MLSFRQIWLNLAALGGLLALLGAFYFANTGARAVPGLIEDLQRQDLQAQLLAAEGLKAIGVEAKAAVEPLTALALSQTNQALSVAAAGALPSIDLNAARKVMQAWLPKLHDADVQIRRDAASTLGALGPVAKPAVTPLVVALNDPDMLVRERATRALGSIGIPLPIVLEGLQQGLRDPEWAVRHAAVMQFAFGGFSGQNVRAQLQALTQDGN